MSEPRAAYNTSEDLFELAQEYKETKQRQEVDTWKLADLAHEAAQKFDVKQFAKETGENINTLRTYGKIAGIYQSSNRYYLSFKHHMVAAYSDKRDEWLKKAQDNGWSTERLRREMNPPKEKSLPAKNPEPVKLVTHLPIDPSEPEIYRPSYDEILETLNGFEFSDEGKMFLRNYGKLMFQIMQGLWGDERTIVFERDQFVFRIIKPPIEDGVEVGGKEGPSE